MTCNQCGIDKIYNRTTFSSRHNKDCIQYSDYDDKMEIQRKYAETLNEQDRCIKIHSSPRPIDATCNSCYEQFWLRDGHECDKLIGFPMEIL